MEKYLVVLTIVGIVDAISYMLVTPSLIFYVLQNGGSQGQYGIIMSAFSFSSFCTKPLLGWWSDKQGFRLPYMASVGIALLGGAAYLMASSLPKGSVAVNCILLARLLGGCGAANSALGFAYVARSVPPKEQTSTNSLLSLCRILGMAVGPGLNVLVAKVDLPITPNWKLDSLNSVGIVLILANLISATAIYNFLDEPKAKQDDKDDENGDLNEKDKPIEDTTTRNDTKAPIYEAFCSFLSLDIMVPMLSIFTFNANFQIIETAFAPAAFDGIGWGTVESSMVLGSIAPLFAAHMYSVIRLSKSGVSDSSILSGGLVVSIFGYTALYFLWIKDSNFWYFYLPIVASASSFPYMASTTRSIFTVSVNHKAALKEYQGILQAVLSMAASVAGFTTPGIVAAYVLRSPEQVLESSDMRELTPYSLFAPIMSLLVLLGVVYLRCSGAIDVAVVEKPALDQEAQTTTNERSSLLSSARDSLQMKQKRRSSNLAIMLEGQFDGGLLEETTREIQ